jgi:HAD superfamily hydrolase (TIGR01509 family)
MDGVLVDSVSHKYDRWEQVLHDEFGLEAADAEALVGLNTHDKYDYLVDTHGLEADRETFARLLNQGVGRIYEEQVELLPGIASTFEWLAARSVPKGLVSAASRPKVDTVVARFDLDERLDAVVSADDIEADSKPDPAIYRHAAAKLGVDPTGCLAVEDSPHGVTAATGAGSYCLGYAPPNSPKRDIGHADEVVGSPSELQDRIRTLVVGGPDSRR